MDYCNTPIRLLKHPEATASIFPFAILEITPPPDVGRAHRAPPVVGVDRGL